MSTIRDQIEDGFAEELKHSNFHQHIRLKNPKHNVYLIMNYESLYRKYRDYFKPYIYEVTLTDKQLLLYESHPRKFANDFFGNINLWSLLLLINGMVSSVEFPKKHIFVFEDGVVDLLSELLTIEHDRMAANRREVEKF